MKTLDEAMVFLLLVSNSRDAEEIKSGKARAIESVERRKSIVQEVSESDRVRSYIYTFLDHAYEELGGDVVSLAFSMFATGVLIGMEMERQEL